MKAKTLINCCPICNNSLNYDSTIGWYCESGCGYNHSGNDYDSKPGSSLKTILLVIFCLININLFSQLTIDSYVELGVIDDKLSLMEGNYLRTYHDEYVPYSDIMLKFEFRKFVLEQNLFHTFTYKDGTSFTPLEMKYKTKLYYDFGKLQLGYEHMCLHPVVDQTEDVFDGDIKNIRRESWDRFFIRYNFKLK